MDAPRSYHRNPRHHGNNFNIAILSVLVLITIALLKGGAKGTAWQRVWEHYGLFILLALGGMMGWLLIRLVNAWFDYRRSHQRLTRPGEAPGFPKEGKPNVSSAQRS